MNGQGTTESGLTFIAAPQGVAPGTGYTHVVGGPGRLFAISGQVALDADGALVGDGDAAAQAGQVFRNLGACLASVGAGFENVIKLTYFLTDFADLPAVRLERDRHFDPARLPASSAVQVSALFRPDVLLEVEALALIP